MALSNGPVGKGKTPKLAMRWRGPYTILEIRNDCLATIRNNYRDSDQQVVNIARLKHWMDLSTEAAQTLRDLQEESVLLPTLAASAGTYN